MKHYRYVKSNAFTSGDSLGNPAACIFTGQEGLSPKQMQIIAAEHKGFVMEVVFCGAAEHHHVEIISVRDIILTEYKLCLKFFEIEDAGSVVVRGVKDKGDINNTDALKDAYMLGLSV